MEEGIDAGVAGVGELVDRGVGGTAERRGVVILGDPARLVGLIGETLRLGVRGDACRAGEGVRTALFVADAGGLRLEVGTNVGGILGRGFERDSVV